MKKLLLLASVVLFSIKADAQIGATAPDFTVTDLNGNQIKLYQDILDQGLIAVIDVSATWCGPCWSLHSSHALRDLHETYGANGSNQLRVVFYEGDANTTLADLQGTTAGTQGNWLADTPYPIINESPLTLNLGIWAPDGFPTVSIVRPSDKQIVADTWNLTSLQGQVNAINNATGITLQALGINEVTKNMVNFVYPNPANDMVSLNLEDFKGLQSNIEVYNMQGQLVLRLTQNSNIANVSVSELPSGKYLVRAFNNEKSMNQLISVAH
ncbi:MAG: T9SS type A sorting domain-containing protein [Bacteroidia bacterium]